MNTANHQTPSPSSSPLRVLRVDASARRDGSVSRRLGDLVLSRLDERVDAIEIVHRDVSAGLPFVTGEWVEANFTDPSERTQEQKETLSLSDAMVAELEEADVLLIGTPIYNFGVPSTLKAWIDMVARARKTFRYTENGPVGLLENKKAYLLIASGGTAVGSEIDFASGYLKHVLGFIGIHDVEIIAADRLGARGDEAFDQAAEQIETLFGGMAQVPAAD